MNEIKETLRVLLEYFWNTVSIKNNEYGNSHSIMENIMQTKYWQYSIAGLLLPLLFSPSSFAAPSLSPSDYLSHQLARPVITFTGGTAFNSNLGESKNFPAQDGFFSFFNYSDNH